MGMTARQQPRKTRWISKTIFSVLIGAAFCWLAGRDVRWSAVWAAFSTVDYRLVLAYAVIITAAHFVRTFRWGLLLAPLDRVSFSRLFAVSTVGNLILVVLPFRLGEFARPLLIADRSKIRVSAALGTIVVERLIDSLFMALLLVGLLFLLGTDPRISPEFRVGVWILTAGLIASLGVMLVFLWKRSLASRWVESLIGMVSPRLAARVSSLLDAFIDGLMVFPNARLLLLFLGSTGVLWWMNAGGLLVLFGAFAGLDGLGWTAAWTVLSLICIGLMIPAGPVMVGNFHFFVKLGLSLFVVDKLLGSSGLAYAILVHALQVGVQVGLGLLWLFSGHISLSHLVYPRLQEEPPPSLGQSICEG